MAEDSKSQEAEKIMIIPLRQTQVKSPKSLKMKRSIKQVRSFLAKHMKSDPSNVSISQQLNESLWKRGIHNPPAKLKIKVSSDKDGKILASMIGEVERPKKDSKAKKAGLRERLKRKAEQKEEGDKSPSKERSPSGEESTKRRREEAKKDSEPAKEKKEEIPKPPEEKVVEKAEAKLEEKKPKGEPSLEKTQEEIEQEVLLEQ